MSCTVSQGVLFCQLSLLGVAFAALSGAYTLMLAWWLGYRAAQWEKVRRTIGKDR